MPYFRTKKKTVSGNETTCQKINAKMYCLLILQGFPSPQHKETFSVSDVNNRDLPKENRS